MSWSVSFIGKPEKVAQAIEEQLKAMPEGQSKEEFAGAAPLLAGLARQTFNKNPEMEPLVKIMASGHGGAQAGEQTHRQVSVALDVLYGKVLT